jgi:hypothetical protein
MTPQNTLPYSSNLRSGIAMILETHRAARSTRLRFPPYDRSIWLLDGRARRQEDIRWQASCVNTHQDVSSRQST